MNYFINNIQKYIVYFIIFTILLAPSRFDQHYTSLALILAFFAGLINSLKEK